MTQRIPLVIANGQIQQLQSGDSIANNANLPVFTNGESSATITIGMPVYISAADTVKMAKANALGTINPIGFMQATSTAAGSTGAVQLTGDLSATTVQWDAVCTGESGGLTPGALYYLDPAAYGKITVTAPTAVGQYIQQVGTAISTTEMKIDIKMSILL